MAENIRKITELLFLCLTDSQTDLSSCWSKLSVMSISLSVGVVVVIGVVGVVVCLRLMVSGRSAEGL